jgi:pyruvate,water dikinase
MGTFTKPFEELTKSDVPDAGGKGASLGEMTRAGIPVPPGFVVLTPAFRRFILENQLADDISSPLKKFDPHDAEAAEVISEQIRNAMMKAVLPHELAEEITKDFRGLHVPFVAVRSSATAEDTGKTSWAGELDSYLNTTE